MESGTPLVNSWTEWGPLEQVCVGQVYDNHCVCNKEPAYIQSMRCQHHSNDHYYPVGQSHSRRIQLAQKELAAFVEVLEGEMVQVKAVKEFADDIQKDVIRMRSKVVVDAEDKDARTVKYNKSKVVRPSQLDCHKTTNTPWWEAKFQWGPSVPRDTIVTMGNTILEAPMSFRCRYFDNYQYRDIIYDLWKNDKRVKWVQAPRPSMRDSMWDTEFFNLDSTHEERLKKYQETNFTSALQEVEMAFDAADLLKFGKDVLVRKALSCNDMGIDWLRREFPHLRFHKLTVHNDYTRHADEAIVPVCGPTGGSQGIAFVHQTQFALDENLDLFRNNDWQLIQLPEIQNTDCFCLAGPGPYISSNMLSLSPKCVIIEEQEVAFYHLLTDLGFDVITVPLKHFVQYGGAIHCSTWDIRRDEELKDYFPNQDYEAELKKPLSELNPKVADYTPYKCDPKYAEIPKELLKKLQ